MPSAVRWFVWTALQCVCHFTMSTGTPTQGLSGTRGSYETPAAMVAAPSRGGTNTTLSVPGFGLAPAHSALPMTEVRDRAQLSAVKLRFVVNPACLGRLGLRKRKVCHGARCGAAGADWCAHSLSALASSKVVLD